MYSGILPIIKRAAVDAVNATQPVNVTFGTVLSTSPLRVQITAKLILERGNLILAKGISEDLNDNDTVILLRVQGGQSYVILDKAVM